MGVCTHHLKPATECTQLAALRGIVQLSMSRCRGVRRYLDVPLHLSYGKRALHRAAHSARARAAVASNQSHRENRSCICAPSEADHRYETVHLTSLQQARWVLALGAPLYGAPLAGRSCSMGVVAGAVCHADPRCTFVD